MQLRVGGRRVMVNGRVANIGGIRALYFMVEGYKFPFSNYPEPTSNPGQLRILSNGDNFVTINYGDGTVLEFPFLGTESGRKRILLNSNNPSGTVVDGENAPTHIYTDANDGLRQISISFRFPERIYSITFIFLNLYQAFPRNIDVLENLSNISIRLSHLTSFPDSMNKLQNLMSLNLDNIGTAISERIPNSILQTNLKNLTVSSSTNLQDVYASNFYTLCENLGDTLEYLDVISTNILTLPPNFPNLTKLKHLGIGGRNEYTTLPPEVNEVPTLESLVIGVTTGNNRDKMTHLGSFSNLVNLQTLTCRGSTELEQFIPDDFENCVSMKTYDFGGSFRTQVRIDRFVDEMYTFITTNASMTTGNTKFRQMAITSFRQGHPSPTPTGIYQEPSGYVQGSNNGTPANQLEKVWVLVNQYQTTWTY